MPRTLTGALLLSALALSPAANADSWFASWQVGHFDRLSPGHYSPRHYGPRIARGSYQRGYRHGYRDSARQDYYAGPYRFDHWPDKYRHYDHRRYDHRRYDHRHYNPRHYNHRHYAYRRHGHDHSGGVALLGGVLLGSLLSQSAHSDHGRSIVHHEKVSYRSRPVVSTTRVLRSSEAGLRSTVRRQPVLQSGPSRRLLKDLQGDCFEIVREAGGRESRRQLPAEACRF